MKGQKIKSTVNKKGWLFSSALILVLYCGMLFVEAIYFNGSMRIAILTTVAGTPLVLIVIVLSIATTVLTRMPLIVAILTQITFLAMGTYLQELEFYFFIMLLVISAFSMSKNFNNIVFFGIVSGIINILAIIFLIPQLDWIDSYRFFMKFILCQAGSLFILVQTYNIVQKESGSEQAMASFLSLLRSTPNLMVITDAENRVRYLSDQMAKFIQYENKEYAIGQPLIDLISDKESKIMFADMLDADGFYEKIAEIDVEGKARYYKIISDKLIGEVKGQFIDISDITPTVQSNFALMEARLAADEANKSKSNFLATMSHEIRTPMNAIIGIAQIQMQKKDLPPDYATALEKIYGSGNNLLGIINDILDMSKIETGKLELNLVEYDLSSLINDAVQLNIVRLGSKQIDFLLDVDESLPLKLIGDELRIKQILNNLLSNGIKYTNKGYVKLSVSHIAENGDIILRFIVEDTGQGMKDEDVKKLFSEYLRFNINMNRVTEGTGLGLSITKKLAELMNGTIKAESEFGKGSTFIVEVKQKAVECGIIGTELAENLRNFKFTGENLTSKMQIVRSPMPYGKVLVVDDVETNLYVAEGFMSPYKIKIESVISGFAAIDLINEGNTYDIIFMDHMMPKMDGIETTHRLRALGYNGTIVALTANALVGNDEMFRNNGFDDFISKPIDISELNNCLNTYIRDRHPEEAKKYKAEAVSVTQPNKNNPKLFKIFRRDAEKAIVTLSETNTNGNLKKFTTTAHAMKSALANIGENTASSMAFELEKAGLNGDTDYINANTKAFINTLEQLVKKLACAESKDAEEEDMLEEEDTGYLKKHLLLVKTACENFDDTSAYTALDRLNEKQWKTQTASALETIRDTLYLHSDFDGAAKKTDILLKR